MTQAGALYLEVLPDLNNFAKKMNSGLQRQVNQSQGRMRGMFAGIGKAATASFAAAGLAAGAAFASSLNDAIKQAAGQSLLAARLGLTEVESATAGRVAGQVFAGAYGESMGQVNDAIRGVHENIGDLGNLSESELSGMTKQALNLSKVLNADVGDVTRGVGQLMRNGLATDAQHAFDIISAGTQSGAASTQDLLDTIEEYAGDMAQLGLTGEQSLGMIAAGLKAGARNGDLAADAVREFSIRAIDGSSGTAAAYRALGLDAGQMAAQIAAGGPAATAATSEVIRALAGMSDPLAQEAAGVALFGTRFEELGIDVVAAMDPLAASLGDVAGAAANMGDTLRNNPQVAVRQLWRGAMQGLTTFIGTYLVPAIMSFSEWAKQVAVDLQPLAQLVGDHLVAAFRALSDWWAEHGPAISDYAAQMFGDIQEIITGFVDIATAAWDFFGGTLTTVAQSLVTNLTGLFQGAWQMLTGTLNTFIGLFTGDWQRAADGISTVWGGLWQSVGSVLRFAVTSIGAGIGLLIKGITSAWSAMKTTIAAAWSATWNTVRDAVSGHISGVVGAANNAWGSIKTAWQKVQTDLQKAWSDGWGKVRDWLAGFSLSGQVKNVVDGVRKAWQGLVSAFSGPINTVRRTLIAPLLAAINRVKSAAASLRATASAARSMVPTFHSGGIVGRDWKMTPSTLRSGEMMVKALAGEEILTADDPRHRNNLRVGHRRSSPPLRAPAGARDHTGSGDIARLLTRLIETVEQLDAPIILDGAPVGRVALRAVQQAAQTGQMRGAL